jgi:dimethylaniline monooxygenase (N-oxide forming)
MQSTASVVHVAVIGAGPCGLAAAKCLIEEGLEPVVFEQHADLGGVWVYQENLPTFPDGRIQSIHASAYKCLTTNSSRNMSVFSDFPLPFETKNTFLTHEEIMRYLRAYAQNFELWPRIRFNTQVKRVQHLPNNKWLLELTSIEWNGPARIYTMEFDAVLVCSGMFWNPNIPHFPGEESFGGAITHSHYYRVSTPFEGKRVLIVGIGNSAMDIGLDLAAVADVTFSARSGAFMIPTTEENGSPIDLLLNSRKFAKLPREERHKTFFDILGPLTAKFVEHGMLPPSGRAEDSHFTIVKDPNTYKKLLDQKKVKIKCGIARIEGPKKIVFVDGTSAEFDIVLLATGYILTYPFLQRDTEDQKNDFLENRNNEINVKDKDRRKEIENENQVKLRYLSLTPGLDEGRLDLFKRTVHPLYKTLCFIAQVDAIGNLFSIGEMQARWVSKILSGRAELPSTEEMIRDVEVTRRKLELRNPKFPLFINYMSYMDELAQLVGCVPRLADNDDDGGDNNDGDDDKLNNNEKVEVVEGDREVSKDKTKAKQKNSKTSKGRNTKTKKEKENQVLRQKLEGTVYPVVFRLDGHGKWSGARQVLARL